MSEIEKLRGLLARCDEYLAEKGVIRDAKLRREIRAALSQQAEPVPAQGERTALAKALASSDWPNVSIGNKALVMQAIDLLTRPAQTEQRPVGEVRCDGDMIWQIDGDPAVWRRLGEGIKLYAAPIAQTALQPEQSRPANKLRALAEIWDQNADEADEFGNAQAAEALRLAAFELRATLSAQRGETK